MTKTKNHEKNAKVIIKKIKIHKHAIDADTRDMKMQKNALLSTQNATTVTRLDIGTEYADQRQSSEWKKQIQIAVKMTTIQCFSHRYEIIQSARANSALI